MPTTKEHTVTMPVSLWDRKVAEIAELKKKLLIYEQAEMEEAEVSDLTVIENMALRDAIKLAIKTPIRDLQDEQYVKAMLNKALEEG